MPGNQPGGFEYTMGKALFGPLGRLTVPKGQRNFAVKRTLPTYGQKIAELRKDGAMLVTVYGVGTTGHIAFWGPYFAEKYSLSDWKKQTHGIGVALRAADLAAEQGVGRVHLAVNGVRDAIGRGLATDRPGDLAQRGLASCSWLPYEGAVGACEPAVEGALVGRRARCRCRRWGW